MMEAVLEEAIQNGMLPLVLLNPVPVIDVAEVCALALTRALTATSTRTVGPNSN